MNSPSESLQHNGLHWSRSAESEWEKEKVSTHKQQNTTRVLVDAGINTATLSQVGSPQSYLLLGKH